LGGVEFSAPPKFLLSEETSTRFYLLAEQYRIFGISGHVAQPCTTAAAPPAFRERCDAVRASAYRELALV